MINFRKLKQDFSPTILKEGRLLYEKEMVVSGRIISLDAQCVRLNCRVIGNYENSYESQIEINSQASSIIDSDCDCPYKYDCQHIAAALFYMEEHFNEILLEYSKETQIEKNEACDDQEKEVLREAVKQAEHREVLRKGKKYQKEVLQEYISASLVLGQSPFFIPEEHLAADRADLMLIFLPTPGGDAKTHEIRLALRLPFRSKPLNVLQFQEFLDAMRYGEPIYIGSKRFFFENSSFESDSWQILKLLLDHARFLECKGEKNPSIAQIDEEIFGIILARSYEIALARLAKHPNAAASGERLLLPCLYAGTIEEPLRFAALPAGLHFQLEYLETNAPKLFLKPSLFIDNQHTVPLEEALLFECAKPGIIYKNVYYRFQTQIKRKHLRNILAIRDVTIPEPLFGTFVENALPELQKISHVTNLETIEQFVTLPFVEPISAICDINYLDGELEAAIHFVYNGIKVPAAAAQLGYEQISSFVTGHGILARNLTEEQKIIEDMFQDFLYQPQAGVYVAKSDKKIVEFMTEVIPRNQHRVKFNCPENLLDQFIYDDTSFKLILKETDQIDSYQIDLQVCGNLRGLTVDLLWECLLTKKTFLDIGPKRTGKKKTVVEGEGSRSQKILVLDLDRIAPVVQIFDELGINKLDNHSEKKPLWNLANISASLFEGLPIEFSMSENLKEIQDQMLGKKPLKPAPIPAEINAVLRTYQEEGIHWLDRLRAMRLNGVLADDMGLGKTLQAIIAITQLHSAKPEVLSIIVCPTSLIYNWKEEFNKFNPKLRVLPIDGTPSQRKKLLTDLGQYDVVITSYSLLQKDIDIYKEHEFGYAILDEAQHIKNRGTRNAKSVKMILAAHRLILTGTPIENSLEDLWSLFDYLMPGLLSSYDRFVEKYLRSHQIGQISNQEVLRKKVSPFILRRMKKDVLEELPPVSEIIYHCHLSDLQKDLYRSYADSAREELSQLVKKEGYDKVQIQVLATLTRLKQICCHPAIFAKEKAESGDSSKYEMLMELLQTLIEGKHKTVIFSQYTRMLRIMREDLKQLGIKFCYLDGSSKNRLEIVKEFNEDDSIMVFLVSLKAGGTGLNLVGADTVIHYDMWWNPAVENQATDRVHRLGQKSSVSSYKLITLGTIEEKILELQNRKKGLVKTVISAEDEAIAKLTWEEVLELLQT